MTARILVVDDIHANVKLLEAKLTAEYFDVITATSGSEALEMALRVRPDIILLDVMMPKMDGFEVCVRLKADPETAHIPVIMITALDQPSDRVRGLEAGADDFLTKPVSDVALFARVKSLVRLKMVTDEIRSRARTGEKMGLHVEDTADGGSLDGRGRILLVEDRESAIARITGALGDIHDIAVVSQPEQGLIDAAEKDHELVIISLSLKDSDGLRLCSQLRSLDRVRKIPIVVIVEPDDTARLLRGLEMGVNDYLMRPVEPNELKARVRTQLRRKRYTDRLRESVEHSMEMAVIDPLTGLYNRRYMEGHVGTLVEHAAMRGKSISILVFDIDYFKAVNDTHGHDVGDEVLKEFAHRLKAHIRGIDMACRVGGEEFVLVLPDTDMALAYTIGERLRQAIANVPFDAGAASGPLSVTMSVGIASLQAAHEGPEDILKRADAALYRAKNDGRNRVVADAA